MKGFGKVGIVFLVLVMVLGTLGIGYAMWDKTLTIEGTVNTGSVDAEFTAAYTDDDGVVDNADHDGTDGADVGDPDASGKNVLRKDKGVGSSSAAFAGQTASVTVKNAYPCYYTTAFFGIHNNGTIPVKVQVWEEHCSVDHWVSFDSGVTWEFKAASEWYEIVPCTKKHIIFAAQDDPPDADADPDLTVHLTQIEIGTQIDPSQTVWMDVDIHVGQGAEQLAGVAGSDIAAYTFDERVLLVQWNEFEG